MRKALEKVYQLTIEMKHLFNFPITVKNREEVIEKLTGWLEEREEWMDKLSPPYTDEERELGEKIYQINVEVEENMQRLFGNLKVEMKKVQKHKKTQQTYSNPYKNLAVSDGTFLDKKN